MNKFWRVLIPGNLHDDIADDKISRALWTAKLVWIAIFGVFPSIIHSFFIGQYISTVLLGSYQMILLGIIILLSYNKFSIAKFSFIASFNLLLTGFIYLYGTNSMVHIVFILGGMIPFLIHSKNEKRHILESFLVTIICLFTSIFFIADNYASVDISVEENKLSSDLIILTVFSVVSIIIYLVRNEGNERTDYLVNISKTLEDYKQALDRTSIVGITDVKGEIIYANDLFCEISKYKREELIGQDHRILNSGYHSSEFIANMWKTIANGEIWRGEIRNKAKDGSIYWVQSHLVPILNEQGKPYQYMAIRQDITEQKEKEEELRKNQIERDVAIKEAEFKDSFLANMSHEIRTPMNGVIGMLDILKETKLDPTQEGYAKVINRSAGFLLSIINDVLDLSKIQAGKLDLNIAPVNIQNIAHASKALYLGMAKEAGVEIETYYDPELNKNIVADGTRVSQIINNFLSNAIKYSKSDKVEIRLLKADENKMRVEVKDYGVGIIKENQERLFDKFFQIKGTTDSSKFKGTGLGLSINIELVKLMGGEIGVEGEESTFWFTFNYEDAKEQIIDSVKEVKKANLELMLTVLLVEDNKVNQQVAKIMLEMLRCNVFVANNGKEAVDILNTNNYNFDLILMDIQMPIMDGVEATKKIKEEKLFDGPIIGLSANAMEGDREKYLNEGFDEYLTKPIKKEKIEEKILQFPLQ